MNENNTYCSITNVHVNKSLREPHEAVTGEVKVEYQEKFLLGESGQTLKGPAREVFIASNLTEFKMCLDSALRHVV